MILALLECCICARKVVGNKSEYLRWMPFYVQGTVIEVGLYRPQISHFFALLGS